ncbi:hypothetical protein DV532_26995 (plasmid) [Pseudomonas sp. Leaf58]|uniref:hypothetical protein n=1 Tax=Pseudomonas sp. Leaf58 TaxID=1736226 RepID=UPI0006F25043|nr:hypothetical protein [Pseudomonas sp. Leaf58]AYG47932.1 hypothetical protein DV532_26995 [Pseudomonas sp. Leaf58]KQN62505.1 hypothetical protein ASF02_10175 [Pseudomonas sp. Leaf58]
MCATDAEAYADKMHYTPEQLVQLRAIDKYSEACAKSTCQWRHAGDPACCELSAQGLAPAARQ